MSSGRLLKQERTFPGWLLAASITTTQSSFSHKFYFQIYLSNAISFI